MNELSLFYRLVETFCNDHSMVNGFQYLDSVDKIDEVGADYLRIIVFPTDFEIQDTTYSITYGVVLQDKVRGLDPVAHVKSNEKLMFVLGQLEEHLYSHDKSIRVSSGDFMPNAEDREGENITSAVASVTLNVHRFNNDDIAFDEDSYFKPITFKVLPVDDTTSLSVSTSSGLCTWKFYSGGSLDSEYVGANSVTHTWDSGADRYFEFFPPDNDYSLIIDIFSFAGKDLYGKVPKEVSKCVNVTQLKLEANQLEGKLDESIGNTKWGTHLYLYDNNLTGSIPKSLFNQPNVFFFFLSNNKFSGVIPKDVSRLTSCRDFHIQNNLLTGNLPKELGELPVVSDYRMNNNYFTSSSMTEFVSPNFEIFRLDNNYVRNSEDINNILIAADNTGKSDLDIRLQGGENAAPTGAGITAKNNLIAKGCTVITN